MSLRDHIRRGRSGALAASALPLAALALGLALLSTIVSSTLAQQPPLTVNQLVPIRLSLEGRLEGPAAVVLVPQDRGYYRQEGVDVIIDEGASALEPITRVASGSHEIGVADI